MNTMDELLHRLARAAVLWKIDEDNLGRQVVRESCGLDNWAKKAYQNRRKSRMELEEVVTEYMKANLQNIEDLAAKRG